jgi:hypothetical protein
VLLQEVRMQGPQKPSNALGQWIANQYIAHASRATACRHKPAIKRMQNPRTALTQDHDWWTFTGVEHQVRQIAGARLELTDQALFLPLGVGQRHLASTPSACALQISVTGCILWYSVLVSCVSMHITRTRRIREIIVLI